MDDVVVVEFVATIFVAELVEFPVDMFVVLEVVVEEFVESGAGVVDGGGGAKVREVFDSRIVAVSNGVWVVDEDVVVDIGGVEIVDDVDAVVGVELAD